MTTKLNRRSLLQGAASLSAVSVLAGCGYSSSNASAPVSLTPPAAAPLVTSSLMITATAIGSIPAFYMGLSYEKLALTYNYFHTSNQHLMALFRLLGKGVLRIGGGSVDRLLWTSASQPTHLLITAANIKALAGFLAATGWRCLYGVNLATSTPALASEEVAYAVSILGSSLLGIEIGNEPDEYGADGLFPRNWSYPEFLARWQMFRAAIIQVAPGVPITGPACGGGNHIIAWTLAFGQSLAGEVTLLTQHYYRRSGANAASTAQYLVSPDLQLASELTTLSAGAAQLGLGYRLSECNSFYHGGAIGVSDSYASSLWVIDFLFTGALFGSTGVNLHTGGGGPGYTPIADDDGAVVAVRPEYYGLLFFARAGGGTLLSTALSTGSVPATAYAIRSPSGLNVVVVNTDTLQNLQLVIETNQNIQAATFEMMQGASLAATSGVTIQGAMVGTDGSFAPAAATPLLVSGTQVTCTVPALSAALIRIS